MNRIEQKFADLKKAGKTGFIPFVTAGDPTIPESKKIILALAENGADIIEIGIPFSDPLADGPIIQAAVSRSLGAGMSVSKALALVGDVRAKTEVPIVLFTYLNPVLKYGLSTFAAAAASAGADGVLVLDLPPEESAEYKKTMDSAGLKTIYLIAPTSTEERIKKIARCSSGFVYCVSRTGVTGLTKSRYDELGALVKRIKRHTPLPVAVGFGVSDRSDREAIARVADAVVVGSAIVRIISERKRRPVSAVTSFVNGLLS